MASHPWPSLFATRRRVWNRPYAGAARAGQDPGRRRSRILRDFGGRGAARRVTYASGHDRHRRPGRHLEPRGPRRRRRRRRVRRPARRGRRRAPAAFAEAHAGRVARPRRPRARRPRWPSSARSPTSSAAPANYAHLRFAADTEDEANGALVAKVIGARDRDRDEARLLRPRVGRGRRRAPPTRCSRPTGLEQVRHHLRTIRRYRPHLLSEPEEKLMAEKSVTGREAWSRLFSEQTSAIRVDLPDLDEPAAARDRAEPPAAPRPRGAPRRPPRPSTTRCAPGLRTRAYIFNTLAQDKATDDRLRSLPDLAVEPQPRQRGERRVGAGAASRRSRAPTTCRSAGTG